MAKLIVLMGNIGTGKTHYRLKNFKNGEVHVCFDDFENLSKDERFTQSMRSIRYGLRKGNIVVVEGTNLTKYIRSNIICHAKDVNCKSILYDFGKGNSTTLKTRINERKDISADVWTKIHKDNILAYEKPSEDEGFDEIITN